MDIWFVIAIVIGGIVLVLFEIFLVPGTTIVGVLGFLTMMAGVVIAYTALENPMHGHLVLLATTIATVILGYAAYKFLMVGPYPLRETLDGQVNLIEEGSVSIGDVGEALGALRPSGTALINGKKFEVHSEGDFIDDKSSIKVKDIHASKIIVVEN